MGFKRTVLQCPNCKGGFSTEYHHGGSIEHENILRNLDTLVGRWNMGRDKDKLFLYTINLEGNHCNIKDNSIEVGLDIFKCVLLWLQKNEHEEIYEYLKGREDEIEGEYNAVVEESIRELEEEIKSQKARILI